MKDNSDKLTENYHLNFLKLLSALGSFTVSSLFSSLATSLLWFTLNSLF